MPANVTKRNPKMTDQQLLHVMSHPVRWSILKALTEQKAVRELAAGLKMKEANVQYHLKALVNAGFCNELAQADAPNRFVYERKPFTLRVGTSRDGLDTRLEIASVIHA